MSFFDNLEAVLPGERIRTNEPMGSHTTFRCGGCADYFVSPMSVEELKSVIRLCIDNGMDYYILGNGSNVLFSDKGYRGVVIDMEPGFAEITCAPCDDERVRITAGAGAMLVKVAKDAGEQSLTGLEFASGIPGTVGGAVAMNAGAYGGEMKDVLVSAVLLEKDGSIKTVSVDELDLGYRHSIVFEEEAVVLQADMVLKKGDYEAIKAVMNELSAKRREKQPLEYPSAGSTFKRPEGYFAGKLIQDAGLKGYRVGGAQVSEKHAGFVVNVSDATASDVWQLMQDVQNKVMAQFGVKLEPEVRLVGFDD